MNICKNCRHYRRVCDYGFDDLCMWSPGRDPITGDLRFRSCYIKNTGGNCADYDRRPPSGWTRLMRWIGWEG
jgi:hypothetical protein